MADTGDIEIFNGSVSTSGLGISITGTTSADADEVHRFVTGTAEIDQVVVTPHNLHSDTVTVYFEVSATTPGTTAAEGGTSLFPMQVRSNERAPPFIHRGNGGLYVRAYASVADKVNLLVQVDRYTKGT